MVVDLDLQSRELQELHKMEVLAAAGDTRVQKEVELQDLLAKVMTVARLRLLVVAVVAVLAHLEETEIPQIAEQQHVQVELA